MTALMACDTSYLFYRAFFGLPATLTSPDGHPVNAVRGTCDFLTRLIERYSPDQLVCAWDDDWRPNWRVDLVASYKAHRVADDGGELVDENLARQIPWIRAVLEAAGVPVVGASGYEADDVLASLAAQHEETTLVVTGDRDLFQLVDEETSVVYVGSSVAKSELITPDEVLARHNVPAARYVDYAVLRGDPSDGLPGVKGIGDKTAAALVQQYPTLEAMVEAAGDPSTTMRPAVRRGLQESADYVLRAREVTTTVATLPLAVPMSPGPDRDAVADFTERLGLGQSVARLVDALVATQ
ncbi:5'-3' exonuclease H3TH domain-containing protein [uncultured Tessaracoccus sp.]|uniref:5'-3' exonuclease n=1 Tax=uncultured Tessaracoccus sp. TaxID=905023 RepID=UPI00260E4B42|nr:5'-3' exonuclease H3TH domain-containing protein [uncultured Tessaracoccus sp.]